MAAISDLRALLAVRGPTRAAEVCAALGISPPTLSRRLTSQGSGEVVRLGRARATLYALVRRLEGLPARLPIFRVGAAGNALQVAELLPLEGRGTWVESASGIGHFQAGLPPAIADMAPAGYLGRRFAEANPALGLPPRLQDWSDDQRLIALARRGEDAPGDLIIGEESFERWLGNPRPASSESDYPRLAMASAEGGAGSSAAGEQPKFAAHRNGLHVLVKFTAGDRSPSDLRWRDLLVCEAECLAVLREAGVPASRARVIDVGKRRFLEIERFDRIGLKGRRGVLTLGYLDDDLFGGRDSWTAASARLRNAKLLSVEDARRMRLLEAVGILTSNGDRHFGNIAFFADGLVERPHLQLAPAYDMLPMDLAPSAGVIPRLPTEEPLPRANLFDVWEEARVVARELWSRVAVNRRISGDFRKMARPRAIG